MKVQVETAFFSYFFITTKDIKKEDRLYPKFTKAFKPQGIMSKGSFSKSTPLFVVNFSNNILMPQS